MEGRRPKDHYSTVLESPGGREDFSDDSRPQTGPHLGHQFEPGELERLEQSIVEMALSRVDGPDELYVGG